MHFTSGRFVHHNDGDFAKIVDIFVHDLRETIRQYLPRESQALLTDEIGLFLCVCLVECHLYLDPVLSLPVYYATDQKVLSALRQRWR